MIYYCSLMCRSIVFPPFFDSLYWGMLIYFLSWNLLDVAHSYLTCCVGCICCFRFSRFRHSCLRQWLACGVSEMIVTLGLPLNVAGINLGCILSMLLSVFNALDPISIPNRPTVALTEFFHAYTVASVDPLPVPWYLISSVCVYLCSYMHIMSIVCSTADAVSSGS